MRAAGLARAKVNLFLHVGPVGPDGYHPLVSLAAFADLGDHLTIEPAEQLSFSVEGPFAAGLASDDNLVLRALRALGRVAGVGDPRVRLVLDKQLPVAAGLGGGSSDAGVALRLTRDLLELPVDDDALADIAADLGADGSLCLAGRAAWAEGRGDRLTFEPRLPTLPAVLINPLAPAFTGQVYAAYDARTDGRADRPAPPTDWSLSTVIRWLARQRNDLETPARYVQPAIGEVLAEASLIDAGLARMSGSGSTVFLLFDTPAAAAVAASSLASRHPKWWIRQTNLG